MSQARAISLAQSLKNSKRCLISSISRKTSISLVIGNQSADLDSFTSSVLYAYFRAQKLGQDITPILNIPSCDLTIRPEFHEVMRYGGIDPADVATLDDLGPQELYAETLPPDKTRWILTDHNKLEGRLGQVYGQRVVGVIDHHEDERAIPNDTGSEPRVVQVCGSCTSLVVREVRSKWDELRSGNPPALEAIESAKIAKFAIASILIDTRNLENPDKTTSDDIEAVKFLQKKISESDSQDDWNNESFYREIKDAKNDIKSISTQGVFRKDYKEWTEEGITLGTSSAVKRLNKLAKKAHKEYDKQTDAWERASRQFMSEKGIDLWLVLTSFNDEDGRHKRELALHWIKAELKALADRFEEQCGEELQLERSTVEKLPSDEGANGRRTWLQSNGAMSRKQVAPMMRRIIRKE